MRKSIAVLEGDGIGPEIVGSAVSVLREVGDFEFREGLIGGIAINECGDPLPLATKRLVKGSDAVLLGAVGGPEWESDDPKAPRPETGLLTLRKTLNVHANLRPIRPTRGLPYASHINPEHLQGIDFVIVRELLGGSYFGESGRNGDTAYDKSTYSKQQIEDVGRTAFELALSRADELDIPPQVTSVDKANVLETSRLWRETVTALHEEEYPGVTLNHLLVDNAALQLIFNPKQFENVIVTENMFGDILSDEAAWITGSIGLVPSASVSLIGPAIFEPIGGSAPDIAGRGIANPNATIRSGALMLRYSFGMPKEATRIEAAVDKTLEDGVRTPDLGGDATTEEVTDAVIQNLGAVTA
jgi:3-isopropylmalate dehydrogenase